MKTITPGQLALAVAGDPQALANMVYNGRMGNRRDSNDGFHFRGRGPKQLTGRDNYTAFNVWLGERFANGETEASITHRFQILWTASLRDNLDPKCRVLFDGRHHDIVGVKEIGTRDGIEISAVARAERA